MFENCCRHIDLHSHTAAIERIEKKKRTTATQRRHARRGESRRAEEKTGSKSIAEIIRFVQSPHAHFKTTTQSSTHGPIETVTVCFASRERLLSLVVLLVPPHSFFFFSLLSTLLFLFIIYFASRRVWSFDRLFCLTLVLVLINPFARTPRNFFAFRRIHEIIFIGAAIFQTIFFFSSPATERKLCMDFKR